MMSYMIGIDTIYLRPTARFAHTEYCSNDALKRHVCVDRERVVPSAFEDAWECDLIWSTNDGPHVWGSRGRTTDMGHADFLEGGVDRRQSKPSPFQTPEDVWAFDAVEEYGLTPFDDLVRFYEGSYERAQASFPNQVFTAGYYNTIISGAIQAFGWEMLLEAAADRQRFEPVLDSIYRISKHHLEAWARTSAPVFISHDDFVWSEGAFMSPDFYRHAIIPRYVELWKPLRKAGKKVLFCSDGNWIEFLDDIALAGADGFIFEPMMPLEPVVERYAQTHVIVSSKVDCRTLTFGSKSEIAAEVDASLALARRCSGFMFAVGNHIPSNVPVENALFYFHYLKSRWER